MKAFTLLIGKNKLISLKRGITDRVSHPATKKWLQFMKKSPKYVHFVEMETLTEHTFLVVDISTEIQLREKVVIIKVKKI